MRFIEDYKVTDPESGRVISKQYSVLSSQYVTYSLLMTEYCVLITRPLSGFILPIPDIRSDR